MIADRQDFKLENKVKISNYKFSFLLILFQLITVFVVLISVFMS